MYKQVRFIFELPLMLFP